NSRHAVPAERWLPEPRSGSPPHTERGRQVPAPAAWLAGAHDPSCRTPTAAGRRAAASSPLLAPRRGPPTPRTARHPGRSVALAPWLAWARWWAGRGGGRVPVRGGGVGAPGGAVDRRDGGGVPCWRESMRAAAAELPGGEASRTCGQPFGRVLPGQVGQFGRQ